MQQILLGTPVSAPDPQPTPLSVSANNVLAFAPQGSPSVSGTSTALVAGGSGAVSFSWIRLSGVALHTGSTAGQTLSFSSSFQGLQTATYRVTVTDGTTTASDDITVSLSIGVAA